MEVHHSHHSGHKKSWKEYFLEFFMLFFAVSLGFLAENLREHYIEQEREKQYMESFVADLDSDLVNLKEGIPRKVARLQAIDTVFRYFLEHKDVNEVPAIIIKKMKRTAWDRSYVRNSTTINQLKNSGGLRLIRNKKVADSIAYYDWRWSRSDYWHDNYMSMQKDNGTLNEKIIDANDIIGYYIGSMGEFVVAPASNCYVLPPGISLSQASLLEPLCVAMHAVRQAEQIAGKRALITGGGPIGQLILRVVRAFGAYSIALSDVSAYAREFALASGAQQVIDPTDKTALSQLGQFDIVLEASGNPSALSDGIQLLHRGGTLVLVGTLPETFSIFGNAIMSKQLRLLGSFRFANVFEEAINLVAAGIIKLDGLITDTYAFAETPLAMERALEKTNSMKIQIVS